jgi:hypothetical protein
VFRTFQCHQRNKRFKWRRIVCQTSTSDKHSKSYMQDTLLVTASSLCVMATPSLSRSARQRATLRTLQCYQRNKRFKWCRMVCRTSNSDKHSKSYTQDTLLVTESSLREMATPSLSRCARQRATFRTLQCYQRNKRFKWCRMVCQTSNSDKVTRKTHFW